MEKGKMETGIQVLPKPIQQHIQQSIRGRAMIPHVYHVTELTSGCQRKAFFKRKKATEKFDLESAYNIDRGSKLDQEWCCLFEINQESLTVTQGGLTVTGTFDFIYDGFLWDLKRPKTIFYKKRDGVGLYYQRQVQAYLSILHHQGRYMEIAQAKVLMAAEDCLAETVDGDDENLWNLIWQRAFALDNALKRGSYKALDCSECPEWECSEKYCEFKGECNHE